MTLLACSHVINLYLCSCVEFLFAVVMIDAYFSLFQRRFSSPILLIGGLQMVPGWLMPPSMTRWCPGWSSRCSPARLTQWGRSTTILRLHSFILNTTLTAVTTHQHIFKVHLCAHPRSGRWGEPGHHFVRGQPEWTSAHHRDEETWWSQDRVRHADCHQADDSDHLFFPVCFYLCIFLKYHVLCTVVYVLQTVCEFCFWCIFT